jgi:hypothetical protein
MGSELGRVRIEPERSGENRIMGIKLELIPLRQNMSFRSSDANAGKGMGYGEVK